MVSMHSWSRWEIPKQREEMVLVWDGLGYLQETLVHRWFLSYSRLVMFHDPPFSCLFSRKEILPNPLCPCGAVEDFNHYCFACPLLSSPSPTYAEIFKSKTPSKLKPIASLLCEKVMTYSDKFLPSYKTVCVCCLIFKISTKLIF